MRRGTRRPSTGSGSNSRNVQSTVDIALFVNSTMACSIGANSADEKIDSTTKYPSRRYCSRSALLKAYLLMFVVLRFDAERFGTIKHGQVQQQSKVGPAKLLNSDPQRSAA